MFQYPGQLQEPWGHPIVTGFSIFNVFPRSDAVLSLKKLLDRLRFLGHFSSFRLCRIFGHQAASNASRTSRLITAVQFFCFDFSSMISLAAIAASTFPLWGMKPHWLLFKPALVCTWCIILPIISLSSTLPATLIKLIGRYLEEYLLSFSAALQLALCYILPLSWKAAFI